MNRPIIAAVHEPSPVKQATGCSIVLPVHNEALILEAAVSKLQEASAQLGCEYEIVLCENGSTDGSLEIAKRLSKCTPNVRCEQIPQADYGNALRHAIRSSQYGNIIVFNTDFWNISFASQALELLRECDMVIGSKAMAGSEDRRPLIRRLITRGFNALLRFFYGFEGTDTHGMKAFRRDTVGPLVERCVSEHFIFDTELVLRVQRAGLKIREIPVSVQELRQPGYSSLVRRIPRVVSNLVRMTAALKSSDSREP